MIKKFDFPIEIENALMDLDSIPTTMIEGIPGELFIVGPDQVSILANIIETLDNVDSKEFETWSNEEKIYYSRLLNNADTVMRNKITR